MWLIEAKEALEILLLWNRSQLIRNKNTEAEMVTMRPWADQGAGGPDPLENHKLLYVSLTSGRDLIKKQLDLGPL